MCPPPQVLEDNEPGLADALPAVILKVHPQLGRENRYTVEFRHFNAADANGKPIEGQLLQEDKPEGNLRRPSLPPNRFHEALRVNDAIEFFHEGGWWIGKVKRLPDDKHQTFRVRCPSPGSLL